MKIAIIGVTGNVGKRLASEALSRGHNVSGIARNVDKFTVSRDLELFLGDVDDPEKISEIIAGHDVVISSVRFSDSDPYKLLTAVRLSGVKRYLIVGGASSLFYSPGITVLESGHVPDWAIDEAKAGIQFLEILRSIEEIDWTFLSPSALFKAGDRTGVFRLGQDDLLTGKDGISWISYEDYAIAMIDEAENASHIRTRFTVGY